MNEGNASATQAEDSYFDYDTTAVARETVGPSGRVSIGLANARKLLLHRGILTLLDQVCVSLTNFSTGILIGRFCSKDELGFYMLGYSVVLFAIAFQQMLISSPFILIRPRLHAEHAARYTGGAYTQQFALGGILSLMLLVAACGFHLAHSRLALVLLSLAFTAPLLLFKEMFRRVCFAHLEVGTALVVDFAVGLLQAALLLALVGRRLLSAPMGNLAIGVACSVLAAGWFMHNRGRLEFSVRDAQDVLGRNWAVGRWIFGSQLLWACSLYSYPWLISNMHGVATAGVWAACFGITALGNPLMLGLQNYVEPRISHAFAGGGIGQMRRLVWKATGVLGGSMLLFSALIFVAGNKVAVLLYGAKYAGNGLTIFVISLSFAAGTAGFAFSCGFFAADRGRLDLRISWVYPIILCTLGMLLVHGYGLIGAAVSLLAANTVATSLRAAQFLITFRKGAPGLV
jgi:O-antigen/teichoic acid export membrane protein